MALARDTSGGVGRPAAPSREPLRIVYIMSRFPKITETFILYEDVKILRLGFHVAVYPLLREPRASKREPRERERHPGIRC